MQKAFTLLLSFLLLFSIVSCKKKGCTDSLAINFDEKAKKDDNSCEFANENHVGTYEIKDSILYVGFGAPWQYRSYSIEIMRSPTSPTGLIIKNYSNLNNVNINSSFQVECECINNVITIPEQQIEKQNGAITIFETKGYFKNDSIYFEANYNNNDYRFSDCWGSK